MLVIPLMIFFFYAREYNKTPSYLSGDEPHYVMMADSLVKDHDLNLKNDYELNRSKTYFVGGGLYPHNSPRIEESSNKWYSIHTVGLPIIIAVPYGLFGVIGARLWLMLLQLTLVVLFYYVLGRYAGSKKRQTLGMTILLTCPLFWQNLGSFYPDFLITTAAAAIVLLFGRKGIWANLGIMFIFLLSTVAHSKGMILLAPLVFCHVAWLVHQSGMKNYFRRNWLPLLAILLGALWYLHYLYSNYKVFSPSQLYGNNGQLFGANPLYNLVAMLTDRSKGLFVNFPLLLIAFPYVFATAADIIRQAKKLYRKKIKFEEKHFLVAGVVGGLTAFLVTVLTFIDWSGSTAPNGRSVFPVMIAVIFVIARYVNFHSTLEKVCIGLGIVLCGWLSWVSISDFVNYMSTGVDSYWVLRFRYLRKLPLFNLLSADYGIAPVIRGLKVLTLVGLLNVTLTINHFYFVNLRKRPSSQLRN